MNLYKSYSANMHLVIITFLISISVISSTTELSFAKIENENKDKDDNDLKDISSSLVDENRKTVNNDLKEQSIQNDLLNDRYPNQFYICGYPQQIISDYNKFEKIYCN